MKDLLDFLDIFMNHIGKKLAENRCFQTYEVLLKWNLKLNDSYKNTRTDQVSFIISTK